MDLKVCDVTGNNDAQTEAKLIGVLEQLELDFDIIKCCDRDRVCIDLSHNKNTCKRFCCNYGIIVQTSSRDVCRIYPHEILYIAIEDRKSVVYVDGKRIETNYPFGFWKKSLNPQIFVQPHSSFLVNLCYVDEVTKDFVKIKHKGKVYSVYTSSRKLNSFKKAFLELGGNNKQNL